MAPLLTANPNAGLGPVMATAVESAPELEVADPEAAPVPKLAEEVESCLVVDAHTELGESPTWDARTGRLYFVDINKATIHVFTVETGVRISHLLWHQHCLRTTMSGCCQEHLYVVFVVTFYSPLGATQAIRPCSSFNHLDSPFSTQGQEL
jgi:hypothetical protein